ncbi:MAG TPA: hypothetical protein VMD92_01080 [Acidobacteriaceae bacterium]|jgi:hypothetical protein|nr:hypothetical protein [Acidobacteriaceae bacterium]
MVLGMNLLLFTRIHVMLSLIGIGTGLFMGFGMIRRKPWPAMTAVFILTTALTVLTGFLFPFTGVTPGIVIGVFSLLALGIAVVARYGMRMAGGWRKAWVVSAMIALYLNFFIFIVQLFDKTPSLEAMGEVQKETVFAGAQLAALVGFLLWTIKAYRQFKAEG